MISNQQIALFGEVLFDLFPTGEKILGGAPFNVAWNLQALGDAPLFISRVGKDSYGTDILQAMRTWGMSTEGVQCDPDHATGQVQVELIDNEPRYHIVADSAYDFIHESQLPVLGNGRLLYHGTLGCVTLRLARLCSDCNTLPGCRFFSMSTCESPGGICGL